MIPIAELVSLGQLVTVYAGKPLWFLRVALYTEQSTTKLHA